MAEFTLPSSYNTESLKIGSTELFPYTLTTAVYDLTGVSLEEIINDLKKSVADGKELIANAISGKGVSTAIDASFGEMASNIDSIVLPSGDALPENVHSGKTFSNDSGAGLVGTAYYMKEINEVIFSQSISVSYNSPAFVEIGDAYKDYPYLIFAIYDSTRESAYNRVYKYITSIGLGTGTDNSVSPETDESGFSKTGVLLYSSSGSSVYCLNIFRNANGYMWLEHNITTIFGSGKRTFNIKLLAVSDCPLSI